MGICVGDSVEVCSKEDGFLGSYFLARVIRKVGKGKFMVEYLTLLDDDDGKGRLQEVVESADIRPVPPEIRVSGFDVLDKVDAYDNDGWWVGRVTGKDDSNYYVHFDSSGDEFTYPFFRLRVHQEYENGRWLPSRFSTKGSQFALRLYLYIVFHELVGKPASWLFSEEKVRVLYAVRIFLGLLSVITKAALVVGLSKKYGKHLVSYTLAMLCLTSGCFFACTSFLPSSFSMYAMSLSSALFLLDKPAMAVAVAVVGVILGWPFSILACLPITIYSLTRGFKQAFLSGAVTSLALLALSLLVDYYYYGRWASSILNLLLYNVLGGGESYLYGTEGPLYYLRMDLIISTSVLFLLYCSWGFCQLQGRSMLQIC